MDSFILPVTVAISLAAVLSIVFHLLHLPIFLASLSTGIILNALGFTTHFPQAQSFLGPLGNVGVVLLLFIVGIELSPETLKSLGVRIVTAGMVQIVSVMVLTTALLFALHIPIPSAVFIGLIVAFSSTIVAVKLFGQHDQYPSFAIKLTTGMLLIQDCTALCILAFFGRTSVSQLPPAISTLFIFFSLIGVVSVAMLGVRYIIGRFFSKIARSGEGIILLSIGWCLAISALASSVHIGLSYEIGAFIAGLSLSHLMHHAAIAGRIRPLRDLFVPLFFITIGLQMNIQTFIYDFVTIGLLLFTLIPVKIIIQTIVLVRMGYGQRTAFYSAISTSQISEFAFVLVPLAIDYGIVTVHQAEILLWVAMLSMKSSAFLYHHVHALYGFTKPFLRWIQPKKKQMTESAMIASISSLNGHAVLFGHNRTGRAILPALQALGISVVVVDFDPHVIRTLTARGISAIFADAHDAQELESLHLGSAQMIVSTIADIRANLTILEAIPNIGQRDSAVIMTAEDADDATTLYEHGADYVFVPRLFGGEHIAELLTATVTSGRGIRNSIAKYRSTGISL